MAAAAIAAAAPQQQPQPPIFRTETSLVRVDIHVLKDGKPVTDLKATDLEILEDGVRQTIESFEFVRVDRPQASTPVEPRSSAAGFELASDPRNRLFVLFLDTYHVTPENSTRTPMPLVRMIDSLMTGSDLFGLMMPQMEIRDLILGRQMEVIRRGLLESRRWGLMIEDCRSRGTLDAIETAYTACYPSTEPRCDLSPTALHLIRRRRESFTLGVLRDLVRYIGANREARTAFVVVSEGWPLYRPSNSLSSAGAADPPTVRIGPGGRLGTKDPGTYNVDRDTCARHLREAAQIDNYRVFVDLMEDARRNNASFYIVDPGGLRTGAASIDAAPGRLDPRGYVETLRTLAANTDGNAIVNTNDLGGALLRVVDDFSGYYLVSYSSTNTKPDGRYRSIKVNVARSGVQVRARKGYQALTTTETKAIASARAAATAPVDPGTAAHADALGRLSRLKPDTVFYLHASIDSARSELHVAGELSAAAARGPEWRQGGEAQILVSGPDGSPAGSARATIAAGGRAFLSRMTLSRTPAQGTYDVAVRLRSTGGTATVLETFQAVRTADPMGEIIAFRSPTRPDAVASFLWWRTEAVRFEAPLAAEAAPPSGRLLDRAGNATAVPVDVTVRDDAAGRWAVATFTLAPLSPGDYVLELTTGSVRRLAPVRVER